VGEGGAGWVGGGWWGGGGGGAGMDPLLAVWVNAASSLSG